jgi:hypothetical protein
MGKQSNNKNEIPPQEPTALGSWLKSNILLTIIMVLAAISLVFITCATIYNKLAASDGTASATQKYASSDSDIITASSDAAHPALPGFSEAEVQQLKDELAEAHTALEEANAAYKAEMLARENDLALMNENDKKVADLESEKNQLLAELDAKEIELKQMTPPELDFKKIIGMYEGKGELATLTYSYEVIYELTKSPNNPLTKITMLYSIPGTLKMGVNFDTVKNGVAMNTDKKTVTVTIPDAYFISNERDESNVKRYDANSGLFSYFNRAEDKDYLGIAQEAKNKAEEKIKNDGMLEYAQRLAGLEFIGLLEPLTSASGYQIIVSYD